MNDGKGWFGSADQVLYVLRTVKADCDEDGNVMIYGQNIVHGLDPQEVVVPAGTEYSVEGKRFNLAALLGSTSYGTSVKVF